MRSHALGRQRKLSSGCGLVPPSSLEDADALLLRSLDLAFPLFARVNRGPSAFLLPLLVAVAEEARLPRGHRHVVLHEGTFALELLTLSRDSMLGLTVLAGHVDGRESSLGNVLRHGVVLVVIHHPVEEVLVGLRREAYGGSSGAAGHFGVALLADLRIVDEVREHV